MIPDLSSVVSPMEGWCTPEKAAAMVDLILRTRPRLCVEIGVFGGRSLVPQALALRELGHGLVIGIDPWKLSDALEGGIGPENENWWRNNVNLHEVHRKCMEEIWRYGLDDWCCILRCRAEATLPLFPDGSIDILHQDSNHSEVVSLRQARQWEPKIGPGGYWILDDTDWETQSAVVSLIPRLGFLKIGGTGSYHVYQRNERPPH